MKVHGRHHWLAGVNLLAITVMTLAVVSVAVISMTGCDSGNPSGDSSTEQSVDQQLAAAADDKNQYGIELEGVEGGFFDDESLLEGAVDIAAEEKEIICVGQGREVRGIVLAPHAQMASNWHFPNWLVGTAEASPLDGELPVGDVQVRLYRVDGQGAQVGEDFARTRTTSGGRFCVRLPGDVESGPTIMVEAAAKTDGKDYRLRRILINAEDADLHLASESFVQILLEKNIDLAHAPLANLMNLEVYAQTAIDLLNPIELDDEDGIKAGVKLVKKTLLDDERFSAGLKRLKKVSKASK